MKLLHFSFACIASVFLCAITFSTYTLLVDTALGLVAFSAFMIVYRQDRPDLSTMILLLPELILLSLIKTSGILFMLLTVVPLCIKQKTVSQAKERRMYFALDGLLVLVPILLFSLYQIRAQKYYGDFSSYRQGLSLARYSDIFASRTYEEIIRIILYYMKELFLGFTGILQVKVLWFSLFGIGGLYFFSKKERKKKRSLFVYSIVTLIVYSVALIMTYLFSMNNREANGENLSCLFRYLGTLAVFLSGLFFMELLSCLQEKERGKQARYYYVSLFVVVLFFSWVTHTGFIWGYKNYQPEEDYTDSAWIAAERYIPENWDYTSASYAVLYDPQILERSDSIGTSKLKYLLQTYLRSENILLISLKNVRSQNLSEKNLKKIANCDYLVSLGDFSEDENAIYASVPIKEYVSGTAIPIMK